MGAKRTVAARGTPINGCPLVRPPALGVRISQDEVQSGQTQPWTGHQSGLRDRARANSAMSGRRPSRMLTTTPMIIEPLSGRAEMMGRYRARIPRISPPQTLLGSARVRSMTSPAQLIDFSSPPVDCLVALMRKDAENLGALHKS